MKARAFYPQKHEDKDPARKGYFTNKISMFRVCRGDIESGTNRWEHSIESARQFNYLEKDSQGNIKTDSEGNPIFKRELKGFGVERAHFFIEKGFGVEPNASVTNPLHMHLIIPNYNEPIRDVSSYSELIPQEQRTMLEDLRHEVKEVMFPKSILPQEYPTPCDLCYMLSSSKTT